MSESQVNQSVNKKSSSEIKTKKEIEKKNIDNKKTTQGDESIQTDEDYHDGFNLIYQIVLNNFKK